MITAVAVVAALSARDTALWTFRYVKRKRQIQRNKASLARWIAEMRARVVLQDSVSPSDVTRMVRK